MSMKHTEEQLQAALVRALPEKLGIDGGAFWKDYSMRNVTPHEWPAIVDLVKDGLTEEQWLEWERAMASLLKSRGSTPLTIAIAKAKWQTRAQALTDIGAIKVEN